MVSQLAMAVSHLPLLKVASALLTSALAVQSDAIGGAQIGLAAASARFKKVFEDPRRNRTFMLAGAAIVVIFTIYLIITHL